MHRVLAAFGILFACCCIRIAASKDLTYGLVGVNPYGRNGYTL